MPAEQLSAEERIRSSLKSNGGVSSPGSSSPSRVSSSFCCSVVPLAPQITDSPAWTIPVETDRTAVAIFDDDLFVAGGDGSIRRFHVDKTVWTHDHGETLRYEYALTEGKILASVPDEVQAFERRVQSRRSVLAAVAAAPNGGARDDQLAGSDAENSQSPVDVAAAAAAASLDSLRMNGEDCAATSVKRDETSLGDKGAAVDLLLSCHGVALLLLRCGTRYFMFDGDSLRLEREVEPFLHASVVAVEQAQGTRACAIVEGDLIEFDLAAHAEVRRCALPRGMRDPIAMSWNGLTIAVAFSTSIFLYHTKHQAWHAISSVKVTADRTRVLALPASSPDSMRCVLQSGPHISHAECITSSDSTKEPVLYTRPLILEDAEPRSFAVSKNVLVCIDTSGMLSVFHVTSGARLYREEAGAALNVLCDAQHRVYVLGNDMVGRVLPQEITTKHASLLAPLEEWHEMRYFLPGGDHGARRFSPEVTFRDVKAQLYVLAAHRAPALGVDIRPIEDYLLKLTGARTEDISDPYLDVGSRADVPIKNTEVWKLCRAQQLPMKLSLVVREKEDARRRLRRSQCLQREIAELVGLAYSNLENTRDLRAFAHEQADAAERAIADDLAERSRKVETRNEHLWHLVRRDVCLARRYDHAHGAPPQSSVVLQVYLPSSASHYVTLIVNATDRALDVTAQALSHICKRFPEMKGADAAKYILKRSGRAEFLHPLDAIGEYRFVRSGSAAEHDGEERSSSNMNQSLLRNSLTKSRDLGAAVRVRLVAVADLHLEEREDALREERAIIDEWSAEESAKVSSSTDSSPSSSAGPTSRSSSADSNNSVNSLPLAYESKELLRVVVSPPSSDVVVAVSLVLGGERIDTLEDVGDCLCSRAPLRMIPPESRVLVELLGRNEQNVEVVTAWTVFPLYGPRGSLRIGPRRLFLSRGSSVNMVVPAPDAPHPLALDIVIVAEQLRYPLDLADELEEERAARAVGLCTELAEAPAAAQKRIGELVSADALVDLSEEDCAILWEYRRALVHIPAALPRLVRACSRDPVSRAELHALIRTWSAPQPVDALEMLDYGVTDSVARAYAVECLEPLGSEELYRYTLQLVQAVKFELHHDSPLARFLLRRALEDPFYIGHAFYWHMRAEIHMPSAAARYGTLLHVYVSACGAHRLELLRQLRALNAVLDVAYKLKGAPKEERKTFLLEHLERIRFDGAFRLPLSPGFEARGIRVPSCRYMDSAKLPLWIVYENSDPNGEPLHVILKAGDDLRQDQLVLQMISIMDEMWRDAGLEMRMLPYACVATGPKEGMLEVVMDAETTAEITMEAGGARAAFRNTVIADWLRRFNRTDEEYASAQENFLFSCAGYCVATYVLGIGDRHNDNIMLQKSGKFFHIDFGHFLGNVKRMLGFNRDKSPFVFTPEFVFVLGGTKSPQFKKFIDLCQQCYVSCRTRARLFINLLAMMLSTGMPELNDVKDIIYLRNQLNVGLTDEEAMAEMESLVRKSLSMTRTRINNFAHIVAHASRQ